jgi:glycosyltransferase involved in cell wall biosynthesis
MKLLFVNASLSDGGSEKAMSLVAQALSGRGHDVTMVLVREKHRTYSVDHRVRVVQLASRAGGRLGKLVGRVRELRRLIASDDFDFVVCYMWDLNLLTLAAAVGTGVSVIVSERAFPGAATRSRLSTLLERVAYRRAHRIVYQTPMAQEHCPPELRGKSVVVPNIIEPPTMAPAASPLERRVVSVGRLVPQKNYPLLIRAFAQFRSVHADWVLEIYGKGVLETSLRELAVELGVADAVRFPGYVADVTARIRDAGMFVLSSDYEGISNALAEAMALGLPVVSTDCPVGGAALLIDDHKSGLLVPVRDVRALGSAMQAIADDPALADRIARGARAAVQRFSPERLAQVWETAVLR